MCKGSCQRKLTEGLSGLHSTPKGAHSHALRSPDNPSGTSDCNLSSSLVQRVLALLVSAVPAERLCDGALLYLLRRGCVPRWRGRLEEIETH